MELESLPPNRNSIHQTSRSHSKSDVVDNVEIAKDTDSKLNVQEGVFSSANVPRSRTQLVKARVQFASLCFCMVLAVDIVWPF